MRARGRGTGVPGGARLGYRGPRTELLQLYRSSEEDLEEPSEQSGERKAVSFCSSLKI